MTGVYTMVANRVIVETGKVDVQSRRERETYINSFPNFVVDVDDQDGPFRVHFAALFSKKQDAIPLLFMHGWPGE